MRKREYRTKKLRFTIDENQSKNLFDLGVGIFTLIAVIASLTFGSAFNHYPQKQDFNGQSVMK